jgi:fatty-acyl-CoA synthase
MGAKKKLLQKIPESIPLPPYFEKLEYGDPVIHFPVLGKLIQKSAEQYSSDIAIIDENDKPHLYKDVYQKVKNFCYGMIQAGFSAKDKIAIVLPNRIEWVITFLGSLTLGVVVPADDWVPSETTKYIIEHASIRFVICLKAKMVELKEAGVAGVKYVLVDQKDPQELFLPEMMSASYSADYEQKLQNIVNAQKTSDMVFILYTSGTTGMPKGAMLTHANIAYNATETGRYLEVSRDKNDRIHCAPPFSHCFGNIFGITMAWLYGVPLCIVLKFDPKKSVEQMARNHLTITYGTPTQFRKMMTYFEDPKIYNRCLRTGIMAGEPCPPKLIKQMMDLGCDIRVIYGLTEASPGTNSTRSTDPPEKKWTVGRAYRGLLVRIEDPIDGSPMEYNKDGEVVIYGPGVMLGYYNEPEKTDAVTSDLGGLKTGDMGVMDPEGYLQITGRIKNMVIRGGNNLYPILIESRMMQFLADKIETVAIVGVKDETYGEEIAAVVKTKEGVKITPQEFVDLCYEQSTMEKPLLSREEVPRYVWINSVDIPVSGRNKVLKNVLKKTVEDIIEKQGLKKMKPSKLSK